MAKLLDEEFLRKIDRLNLVSKKVRVGSLKGERRSLKRGTSVEFADYREYTPGDDLRQVDWNIYARLEKVFLKLFEEEEELTVHILLDCSRSMDWSGPDLDYAEAPAGIKLTEATRPSFNKLLYAKRTTAAIAYMALAAMDRVSVTAIGATQEARLPMTRGKNQTMRMLRFVENLAPGASNNLNGAMRTYASQTRYPGLLFIVSDLFTPGGVYEGIRALQGAGHEVNLLHVLSPDEVNPTLRGDLKLVDSETGAVQEVSVDTNALAVYKREFDAWQHELIEFCQRRAINYIQVDTAVPFDDLVLHYMRRRGLIN